MIALGKYITSHGPRTLWDGPETPPQWKSVTNLPVDQLTGVVGARDANASNAPTTHLMHLKQALKLQDGQAEKLTS